MAKERKVSEKSLANLQKGRKFSKDCPEVARENQKKSVPARKENKLLKDELLTLLANGDTQEKISLALIQEALNGNVKAYETIRDTVGQKPTEDVKTIVMPVINIKGL